MDSGRVAAVGLSALGVRPVTDVTPSIGFEPKVPTARHSFVRSMLPWRTPGHGRTILASPSGHAAVSKPVAHDTRLISGC